MLEAFLQTMRSDPDDTVARMVTADWLEEQGDPRGELLRLTRALTTHPGPADRLAAEERVRRLLAAGTRPIGPWWTNSLGMSFVWVPGGSYVRGSPPDEPGREDNETPHRVTLSRGFYMGVQPVTQGQWRALMGSNPSRFPGDDRPVERVSWDECQEFCRKLVQRDQLTAGMPSPYRLPTEAEWEYACRGAMASPFAFGNQLTASLANYHTNYTHEYGPHGRYRQQTTPVGQFPANAWGLTDLHGNVFEWCADSYVPYPTGPVTDPVGMAASDVRVLRGGSWHSLMSRCRSACRAWGPAAYRGSDVGFRVCFRLDFDFTI